MGKPAAGPLSSVCVMTGGLYHRYTRPDGPPLLNQPPSWTAHHRAVWPPSTDAARPARGTSRDAAQTDAADCAAFSVPIIDVEVLVYFRHPEETLIATRVQWSASGQYREADITPNSKG